MGLEPTTSWLPVKRSSQLSYIPMSWKNWFYWTFYFLQEKIVMQIYTFVWISIQKPITNSFTNKNKRLSNITWFKLHFIIKKLEVLIFSINKKWGAANCQLVSIDDIISLYDNVKISTIHYLEYQYLGYLLKLLLEQTLRIWHHLE